MESDNFKKIELNPDSLKILKHRFTTWKEKTTKQKNIKTMKWWKELEN